MIKAIVTSDNHLGIAYARLRPERLEQRRKRLQKAFAHVVDEAITRQADLFLHAGDLFDRFDPRNADRVFVARQARRLQDAGIVFCAIAGNHDSPRSLGYDGGILPHEEMDALGAIRLFRTTSSFDEAIFSLRGQRVRVRGMSSDFNRPADSCPLQELTSQELKSEAAEDGKTIELVLLHYGVKGWAREDTQEPCLSLENLDKLGADAICVGHLHARNQQRLPGGALLLNPGATEHVNFGEEKLECGFWMLSCYPERVKSECVEPEYIKATPQRMQTIQIELTDALDSAEEDGISECEGAQSEMTPVMRLLLARMDAVTHTDQLLRVRLAGRIPRARYQEIDLNLLQTRGLSANFHCQIETDLLVPYDEFGDASFGYGVSFEVETELQNTVREMSALLGDDPLQQDILAQAGRDIAAAYARLR